MLAGLLLAAGGAVGYVRLTGVEAVDPPGAVEAAVMDWLRSFATPGSVSDRANPVSPAPELLSEAREHYADHCAVCHGADGSGDTAIGRGLSPRPPDLRAASTQAQPDGALFHAIERGIRFTGMPAFTTGTPEGEAASWALVALIRTMPRWTAGDVAEVAAAVPRPPADVRREIEEEQFLSGGEP